MRHFLSVFFVCLMIPCSYLIAYDGTGFFDDPMLMLNSSSSNSNDPEKLVEEFQIQFIENTYTRPLLETKSLFATEDDEDGGFMSFSTDDTIMSGLMSYVLAKELAKRDAFGLKQPLLNQVEHLMSY